MHVRAANVTIKNSLIVGDGNPKYYGGMLTNYDGKPNLRVYNTTIHESSPSPYNTEGVVGFNFLLDGVTVIGQIDNVQIRGSNVTIRNSTLKDTRWYASHPNQGGGPTHSDNVQVLQGDNILIENNTITGSENFAVLGAPEQNTMRNLVVRNNYLAGGGWTAKFSTKGGFAQDVTLSGNRFGGGSKSGIDLIVVRGVNLTMGAGNVRTSGGTVPITWSSS